MATSNSSRNEAQQASELETAILARAQAMAEEQRSQGKRQAEHIRADFIERLRLREERALLLAKAAAERAYHRKVQASELQMQADLDRLRWDLVQSIVQQLSTRLHSLIQRDEDYLALLRHDLHEAAMHIERDDLVAQANPHDYALLAPQWDKICQEVAPGKNIALKALPETTHCLGGLLIYSADKTICVDQTFEGKILIHQEELHQVILSRLLPSKVSNEYMSLLFNG